MARRSLAGPSFPFIDGRGCKPAQACDPFESRESSRQPESFALMSEQAAGSKNSPSLSGGATALFRLISMAALFAAWEIAGRVPISPAFPGFLETMTALTEMIADGRMGRAYYQTIEPLVIGIGLSALVGVAMGVVMGLSRTFQWVWEPVFVVMQAAPMAALIPLITFVYGIGTTAKVVAVIILAAPVIVLNSFKAVRNTNPSLIQMCRSFQGTGPQLVWKIIIPDASPIIFAGLRLGVAAGFIGVILAELLITPTGIGDLITYHRSVAEYADMYAAVFSIIAVAAVTVGLLEKAETRYFRPETKTSKP
jgi:NitT/TauT family transport system permease protein